MTFQVWAPLSPFRWLGHSLPLIEMLRQPLRREDGLQEAIDRVEKKFGVGVCNLIYGAELLGYITVTALDNAFITKLLVFCNRSCLYIQGNRGNSLGAIMEASNLSEALASIVPGVVAERVADELRAYLAGKGL